MFKNYMEKDAIFKNISSEVETKTTFEVMMDNQLWEQWK